MKAARAALLALRLRVLPVRMALGHWLLQVLIALDQLANAILGGWADETLSSHAWRLERARKPAAFMRPLIDWLCCWQPAHCQQAYLAERERAQCPPELRGLPPKGTP